ncbi:MAG TPA: hypothetical protein VFZ29_08570 [Solirubrobacterales bacterium]
MQRSWYDEQKVRSDQLRLDGRRSLAVNLAEGLALSEFVFANPGAEYLSAEEARELFRAAQVIALPEG